MHFSTHQQIVPENYLSEKHPQSFPVKESIKSSKDYKYILSYQLASSRIKNQRHALSKGIETQMYFSTNKCTINHFNIILVSLWLN